MIDYKDISGDITESEITGDIANGEISGALEEGYEVAGDITQDSVEGDIISEEVDGTVESTVYINETDPTVPAWAKEPTKPTYSYEEILNTPTLPAIPTLVSAFENDAGYITDLTGYATESWVDGRGYATRPWVQSQGYLVSDDIKGKADKTYVDTELLKKVDKVNGKGLSSNDYTDADKVKVLKALTEHQSLDGYYTKFETEDLLKKIVIPNKVSVFENDAGYVTDAVFDKFYTKADTDNLLDRKVEDSDLAKVAKSGSYKDLADAPIIPDFPTKLSDLEDDLGDSPAHTHKQYLTEHQPLTDYAKQSWVEEQGYLTEHQDISGKADKTQLPLRFEAVLGSNYQLVSTTAVYQDTLDALAQDRPVYISMTCEGVENGTMYPTEWKTQMDDPYVSFVYHFRHNHEINEIWLHLRRSGDNNTERRILENSQMKRTKETGWNEVPSDDYYPSEWLIVDTLSNFQRLSEKVQSVISNQTSVDAYPSAKAVYDEFIPRPVEIYNKNDGLLVEGTIASKHTAGKGLSAVQTTSQNVDAGDWNLTGLNLKPFKSLKIVYLRDEKNTGTTAEFRLPLDYPIRDNAYFCAAGQSVTFGDRNRVNYCQVVVNGSGYAEGTPAKSCLCFLNGASLYGTAVTTVSSIYIVKIYGCYD